MNSIRRAPAPTNSGARPKVAENFATSRDFMREAKMKKPAEAGGSSGKRVAGAGRGHVAGAQFRAALKRTVLIGRIFIGCFVCGL